MNCRHAASCLVRALCDCSSMVALTLASIVMDGDGLQPGFCYFRFDMVEIRCKRRCSTFYLPEDTFDGIPIPVGNHLEPIAIFVEDIHKLTSSSA